MTMMLIICKEVAMRLVDRCASSILYADALVSRTMTLTIRMATKQKKRQDNIAMRNDRRKGHGQGKPSKGAKKSRPGFEGKGFGGGSKKATGKAKSK